MQENNQPIRLNAAIVMSGDGELILRTRRQLESLIETAGLKTIFFKTSSSRLKVVEIEQDINGGV